MTKTEITRRAFMAGYHLPQRRAIVPPGLTRVSAETCGGCDTCASVCPSGIILLVDGAPTIEFRNGECTFCGACAEHCPKGLFDIGSVTRFDHTVSISSSCLALNNIECQSCRDVCPPGAIRFQPRRGGPFLPAIIAPDCTGCGACIAVCPSNAVSISSLSAEVANA